MPAPAHQTQTIHRARSLLLAAAALSVLALALWPGLAAADQSSQPGSPAAGRLDAGGYQTCFVPPGGSLHCWGNDSDGELGYGNTSDVGVNDTPADAGPVDVGPGLSVSDVSVGTYHTCAILDDGSVRCWGYDINGELGYGNLTEVLSPAAAGPVDIGAGYTAVAISAGGAQTCVIRNDGSVLCWGFGGTGELGYGDPDNLGDVAVPGTHAPVDLGTDAAGSPATAVAITAGGLHTCAILDDQSVRCWGYGSNGQLGLGDGNNAGDSATDPAPATEGPVNLGRDSAGQPYTAEAISAGSSYTCAILDTGQVLCWGAGNAGELGTGSTDNVGLTNLPAASTTVDLGPGRTATAIASGNDHTCAILDNGSVACWGDGSDGELGYGNTSNVGDTGPVAAAGTVDLGPGRTALAITAGAEHTCALLDNDTVRCWGYGAFGQLGYCSASNVGDAQTPAAAGPVNVVPGDGGETCDSPAPPGGGSGGNAPPTGKTPDAPGAPGPPTSEAARARALRTCLARAKAAARRGGGSPSALAQRLRAAEQRCLRRYGRTPGKVTGIRAVAQGRRKIELLFSAAGTDGSKPPAARGYLVKESLSPIRTEKQFASAASLCRGACRFGVTQVGGPIALTITGLKPHTTYYYAVAALDNVSGLVGRRSRTVRATTT